MTEQLEGWTPAAGDVGCHHLELLVLFAGVDASRSQITVLAFNQ